MDFEGDVQSDKHYFFISLHTLGKQAIFEQQPEFKTRVEELWAKLMEAYPQLDARVYNLNGSAMHALIGLSPGQNVGETMMETLGRVITYFQLASLEEWESYRKKKGIQNPENPWSGDYDLRSVQAGEEVESLRDFIIQKMLGGEELSDLGLGNDNEAEGDAGDFDW